MIEIIEKLEWSSIIQDGIALLFKRNEETLVKFLTNILTQVSAALPPIEVAAVPEQAEDDFITMLKFSTPIENNKIRFTSEGGFVIEETT